MDDQSIENEIQAKGLTAPRVTLADIEARIASEHYFTAGSGVAGERAFANGYMSESFIPVPLQLLTFCVLVLKNGFTVTGESACASPENFDAGLGKKIARANAINKVWPLMGYALKERLAAVTEAVYQSGVRHFICGMANGCDLYFAETVLALRAVHPDVTLEAAVPFEGQADRWDAYQRARYNVLLSRCDRHTLLQKEHTPECMMRRNRYMVDRSGVVIAVFNGSRGGTFNTLRYAVRCGLEIIEIDP